MTEMASHYFVFYVLPAVFIAVWAWIFLYTHRVWNLTAFRCSGEIEETAERRFVSFEESRRIGIPTAFKPLLDVS